MAYDVRKLWSQKDFTIDALQGFGSTEYYSVTADTTAELNDDRAVADAVGSNGIQVPALNTSHPANRDLRVAYKSAGPGLTERIISVRYQYAPGGIQFTPNDNPLTRKPRFSWSRITYQESVGRDIYNNPISNSVGDPVDPPPSITMASRMLTIRRHEQGYKPEISDRFENTVNSVEIMASGRRCPSHTIRVESIIPVGEYTDGAGVLEIEYQLEFKWRLAGPPGGKISLIQRYPHHFWHYDLGRNGWYTNDSNQTAKGRLYHTNAAGSADEPVSEDVPLEDGIPIKKGKYVVTSASEAAVRPPIFIRPSPLREKVGDVYMLGWPIYRPENLLLLGL